jgi:DNA uptake protein ComE-like DNA-binding protein
MKRITTALLVAALLAAPTFALDDKQAKKDVATATKAPVAAPAAAKTSAPMDINSATVKELATLEGIGDARSAAIVKGRPYKGKDELVEKKIIPQDVYDKIKDKIIAKQSAVPAKTETPAKKA